MILGILIILLPIVSMMLIGMYDQMMLGGWAAVFGIVLIAVWYFVACATVEKNENIKTIKNAPTVGEHETEASVKIA